LASIVTAIPYLQSHHDVKLVTVSQKRIQHVYSRDVLQKVKLDLEQVIDYNFQFPLYISDALIPLPSTWPPDFRHQLALRQEIWRVWANRDDGEENMNAIYGRSGKGKHRSMGIGKNGLENGSLDDERLVDESMRSSSGNIYLARRREESNIFEVEIPRIFEGNKIEFRRGTAGQPHTILLLDR
tara:strand:+ start:2212 stop:2763 length:552 start_codon:yes stop_codon:yes gene_type:complete